MCNPALIVLGITAVTAFAGVGLTVAQTEAQRSAIESAGRKQREGILRQMQFNRTISLAKAVEARDRTTVATLEATIAGARARAKVRVAGLTGGSAARVEQEAERRTARARQLIGLNLRGAEQQIRFEIEGGQVSAESQFSSIASGGPGGGLAIAASALSGIGQVAGAAANEGLLDGLFLDEGTAAGNAFLTAPSLDPFEFSI